MPHPCAQVQAYIEHGRALAESTWTEAEEKALFQAFHDVGEKDFTWAKVEQLLDSQRSAAECQAHYRNLNLGQRGRAKKLTEVRHA